MTPREERQRVMIKARMHSFASWSDVCIINLSAHGLGIQANALPQRGTYVEICRGKQMIIARVAWSEGNRAGLRAQDPIFIQAFVNSPADPAAPAIAPNRERRQEKRAVGHKHEASRVFGRSLEFAYFGIAATASAVVVLDAIEHALARPLSEIEAVLH